MCNFVKGRVSSALLWQQLRKRNCLLLNHCLLLLYDCIFSDVTNRTRRPQIQIFVIGRTGKPPADQSLFDSGSVSVSVSGFQLIRDPDGWLYDATASVERLRKTDNQLGF